MNVYLAGRIAGVPNYPEIFAKAADKLRNEGFEVFNPAAANQEGRPLGKIMAYLLTWLCEEADAIAMLPGWWRSGGARVEWLLAKYLKLKIIYL
jgi:hypothetical protein